MIKNLSYTLSAYEIFLMKTRNSKAYSEGNFMFKWINVKNDKLNQKLSQNKLNIRKNILNKK